MKNAIPFRNFYLAFSNIFKFFEINPFGCAEESCLPTQNRADRLCVAALELSLPLIL
jgi:hypothetical protein